jgi:nucleotide-binding universal stress UspA family protein
MPLMSSDVGLLMMTGGVDYVNLGTLYNDAQNEASQKLAVIAGRLEGIPHRCYVRHGQVAKSLAAIVEDHKVDLVVLGTHGRTGLGKLMLGSVAEDILRHAPCPVLTVGPRVSGRSGLPALQKGEHDLAPPELDLRRIVVAVNLAHTSEQIAQAAVSLAEEFRSQLTLTHVAENYSEIGRALPRRHSAWSAGWPHPRREGRHDSQWTGPLSPQQEPLSRPYSRVGHEPRGRPLPLQRSRFLSDFRRAEF